MEQEPSTITKDLTEAPQANNSPQDDAHPKVAAKMDAGPLIGYGITREAARASLNDALVFHYGHTLEPCSNGGYHFVDPRNRKWHIAFQQGKEGIFKAHLH